ncbi:o-succinylbenzoate--CoA ligase [Nibricoccus aquaticus]|uniref:O-succinylbenzoate--CoA ligase n=1 Tax=Nibricoccus aquaticus TaxID=2576891 RepID=A0A290QA33_9BACT|nr:AMP-binding protein [Nibricoccus aquaticus]ATC65374.1 o-succinylbenzoate--CoA ligase [Nibricoccus aquaticus]
MERAELRKLVEATGCAVERGGFVFLCDPKWGAEERAQLAEILVEAERGGGGESGRGWLCVPSGGTSGRLKFARHDEQTLGAAVSGFCGHFGLTRVNAVDVLPPHHVSGLMARVRCAVTGGRHVSWSWKELEAGVRPELAAVADGWVLSVVPTQLQRLMGSVAAVEWLRGFRVIFVGGGPAWAELTEEAAKAGLPVSLCYGMTETAAMMAALRPEEFAAGGRSCGAVMPHARVEIVDDATGEEVAAGETGLVRIGGGSLLRGYFPEQPGGVSGEDGARVFVTEDLGRMDERGQLHVIGRRDAVIITGGKKVFPAEVEAVLRASGEFADVAVIGAADTEWGQRVVAFYPAGRKALDMQRVEAALESIAGYKRPKAFVAVAAWPRNEQGKVNREALRRIAE